MHHCVDSKKYVIGVNFVALTIRNLSGSFPQKLYKNVEKNEFKWSIEQYLAGIPALESFHFRTNDTRSRRFVHFQQLAFIQLGEMDIFVTLDPKK